MNLYQRLIAVKKSVDYLQKENQGFGFKYVSSSQVIGSLRNAMNEHGVLLVPEVKGAEVSDHLTEKNKNWKFTSLSMQFTWVNVDDPQETLVCPWYAQGLDDAEKGVGKALTYGEKYFLLKFFNIPTDKDDPDAWVPKNEKGSIGSPHDNDPLGAVGGKKAGAKAEPATPQDTPAQAEARQQVKAWMLEDCDGDEQRVSSRLTDLVGREIHSTNDLTVPELRGVWKKINNGRVAV